MKSVRKVLFLGLITCLLMVVGCLDVNASDKTLTIKSSNKITNSITGDKKDFVIYKTKDKKTVYGLEANKKVLKKKTKLTFDKNADAGLLYILENGYPKTKITGDSDTDKYITESAITLYMNKSISIDTLKSSDKKDSKLVSDYIKPLVENAIKAKNEGNKGKPSIKVLGSKELYLSKDRKYYESDYISVDLVGSKMFTVSSNATILDGNGDKKNKFDAYEFFKIKIPVSKISDGKVTLTIKATVKENVAKIYKPKNDKYQSVAGLFTKKYTLKKEFTLSTTNRLNCKFINGKYYGKKGEVTDEKTYQMECSNSCKIFNENYYGVDGEETSKLIFDKECSSSCVSDDDNYYGMNSRKIDKSTFEKECNFINANANYKNTEISEGKSVEVPNTSSNVSLFNIIFGILLILVGSGILYKRKNSINL